MGMTQTIKSGKIGGKQSDTPSRKKKIKFTPNSSKPLRSAIKKNINEALSKIEDGSSIRVSSKSISILAEMANDLITEVSTESNALALKAGKQTISANETIAAVSLMLTPGSLRDHVVLQMKNIV